VLIYLLINNAKTFHIVLFTHYHLHHLSLIFISFFRFLSYYMEKEEKLKEKPQQE